MLCNSEHTKTFKVEQSLPIFITHDKLPIVWVLTNYIIGKLTTYE